jgi:hypothetical protein
MAVGLQEVGSVIRHTDEDHWAAPVQAGTGVAPSCTMPCHVVRHSSRQARAAVSSPRLSRLWAGPREPGATCTVPPIAGIFSDDRLDCAQRPAEPSAVSSADHSGKCRHDQRTCPPARRSVARRPGNGDQRPFVGGSTTCARSKRTRARRHPNEPSGTTKPRETDACAERTNPRSAESKRTQPSERTRWRDNPNEPAAQESKRTQRTKRTQRDQRFRGTSEPASGESSEANRAY